MSGVKNAPPFKRLMKICSNPPILYYGFKDKRSPVRSNRESGLSYICYFAENRQSCSNLVKCVENGKCIRSLICILQLHGKSKRLNE